MNTPAKPTGASQRSRILIVEDNMDHASTMAEVLETIGCETLIAVDGAEAVSKAFAFHPNIVLLDLGLPAIDGYHVAQILRRTPELSSVLIIAITGYGEPEDKRRSYELGIDLHITKPVNLNFLRELIAVSGKH